MRLRYLFIFLIFLFSKISISIAQQEPVDLYINNSYGIPGNIINVEVKTNNFTDILSFQASLNWDPLLISYVGVSDFGMKDFGEQNFGTTNSSLGHVRFAWEPADAIALTIVDSTVLFTAQFEIISEQPQEISITFTDNISTPAFPIEFANSNYEVLTVNIFEGSITIINNPKDQVNLKSTPNTNCNPLTPNGSLKVDVNEDSLNYIFHWYVGNTVGSIPDYTGYRFNNLPAGDYTLRVLDLNNMILVESLASSVNNDLTEIALSFSSTSNNYCEGGANGSAAVSIINPGNSDLRYYWFLENEEIDSVQARAKGKTYDQLSAGNYKAWVIDLLSECTSTGIISVVDSLVYSEAVITQQNDSLFANNENANWLRNGILIKSNSPFLVPETAGNYSVSIRNEFGCISESEDFFYGVTGLEELHEEISIYPNPFAYDIRISNPDGYLEFIKIFTSQGALIEEIYNIKDKFTDIHLSGSSNGIYLIKVGKEGKISTRKIIKNLSK